MNEQAVDDFATKLLAWFELHGRHSLPWQHDPTPYRVWISEIMLQQTQVTTVIPYYQRFMERFPDVQTLAAGSIDDVLHLWSGLGYYARARNLHAAAMQIVQDYAGCFPTDLTELQTLPGIGRSTAAAILALACRQHQAILDGNVKRVLSRYHAVKGWPGQASVARELWRLAIQHTPATRVAHYTQAIMDLGATVCTRVRPSCPDCPVREHCQAFVSGQPTAFPESRPKASLPERQKQLLLLTNAKREVLLVRRPPAGLWGGLWSFPECEPPIDPVAWCKSNLGLTVTALREWAPCRHTFSHFHLDMRPVRLALCQRNTAVMEDNGRLWYKLSKPAAIGVAAPILDLLNRLKQGDE